jgi:hypothetical protein
MNCFRYNYLRTKKVLLAGVRPGFWQAGWSGAMVEIYIAFFWAKLPYGLVGDFTLSSS